MPLWGSLKRLHCDQGVANLVSKVIKSLCAILGTCHTTDGPPMIGPPPRTIRGNCRCSIHSTVNGSPRTIHGAIDGSTLPLIVPSIFREKKLNVCFFRSSIFFFYIPNVPNSSTHCFLRTEIRSICHKTVWL